MAIVSCKVVNKQSYTKLLKCNVSSVSFYCIGSCTEREGLPDYLISICCTKPSKPQMKNSIDFVQNV